MNCQPTGGGGQKVVREWLPLRPDLARIARREYAKWYDQEQIEAIVDGLRKAGLEIPDEKSAASVS